MDFDLPSFNLSTKKIKKPKIGGKIRSQVELVLARFDQIMKTTISLRIINNNIIIIMQVLFPEQ